MYRRAVARFGVRTTLLLAALVVLAVPFALLVGLIEAQWEFLRELDQGVAQQLHEVALDAPALVTAMRAISDAGGSGTWVVVHSGTVLYLLIRRQPRLAAFVAVTTIGGGLLSGWVKDLVGRPRPELLDPVSHAPDYAFPSGHTMGSAIGVSILLLVFLPIVSHRWRPVLVTVGVLFAFLVGLSRLVLGVHWLTDVLGGWLLSLAWVLVMVAVFRVWRRDRLYAV